ncbi:unnamed protein product, partial [Prorocentrum cordatum]
RMPPDCSGDKGDQPQLGELRPFPRGRPTSFDAPVDAASTRQVPPRGQGAQPPQLWPVGEVTTRRPRSLSAPAWTTARRWRWQATSCGAACPSRMPTGTSAAATCTSSPPGRPSCCCGGRSAATARAPPASRGCWTWAPGTATSRANWLSSRTKSWPPTCPPGMVERLAERGFCAIRTGEATREALGEHAAGGATFDLVALLNVLDRASRPRTLLRQLVGLLTPVAGRLVLAVVLPFRPGVEDGTAWLDPEEELPIFGASWEDALSQLVVEVLEPMGFRVEAASRVPYVSQGDWHTNYYVLSDALLVLSAPSRGGAAGETASGDTAAA